MLINAWPITGLQEAAANGQDIIMANRTLMIGQRDTRDQLVCTINDVLNVIAYCVDNNGPTPSPVRVAFVEDIIELETCFSDPFYHIVITTAKVPFGPLIDGWRMLVTGLRARHTGKTLWDVSGVSTIELYNLIERQVMP